MDHENIDYEGLIAAIETEMPNVEHYIELSSGNVLTIVTAPPKADSVASDGIAEENGLIWQRIKGEPDGYERIPSIDSDLGLNWMREWAETLENQDLRNSFCEILMECSDDCFRRFRRELLTSPEELRDDWFAFRSERLHEFIAGWLGTAPKRA